MHSQKFVVAGFRRFLLSMIVTAFVAVPFVMGGAAGCGGGAAASADPVDTGGGAGEASVASLSTVPTLDLSTLDTSASSSSASLSALSARVSKLAIVQRDKKFGENNRGEGQSARAGCEANAHKDEIFRLGQFAQLDRCYPEAMEAAGIFAPIGEGFAYYSLTPPEGDAGDAEKMCDNIPEDRGDERARCLEESSGGPKAIKIRLGLIGGVLQIDMCESDVLQNEANYAADGSVYTASVTRIGTHMGETDGSTFTMRVDLGTTGTVTDSLVSLGDGDASASAQMNSRFGNGLISYDATAVDNAISGAFAGAFTDPFTGVATTFTGKVHSAFGPTDGCAKFSFSGSPPPMRVQDMIPFDISADQLSGFLQTFGLQLGIELTESNYQTVNLCPNPLFDPENFDERIKPMVATNEDGGCPTVTNTGIECFSISNGTTTTDFGSTEVSQTFTTIANAASSFYATVNAFDLSTLDPTVDTVAFTRNWDCTGTFTDIDFESLTEAQMVLLEPEMSKCDAIQEAANNRQGMGGYNCNEQEQMNGVNDMAQEGPPDFGPYGGEYSLGVGGTCPGAGLPNKLFANVLNAEAGEYCFPMDGDCQAFTVVAGAAAPDPVLSFGDVSITNLVYTPAVPPDVGTQADSVMVTFSRLEGSCTQQYDIQEAPTFEAPQEFGGEGGPGPGEGGGPPQACIDRFGDDVTEAECRGFCSSSDGREACRPPTL